MKICLFNIVTGTTDIVMISVKRENIIFPRLISKFGISFAHASVTGHPG